MKDSLKTHKTFLVNVNRANSVSVVVFNTFFYTIQDREVMKCIYKYSNITRLTESKTFLVLNNNATNLKVLWRTRKRRNLLSYVDKNVRKQQNLSFKIVSYFVMSKDPDQQSN